MSEYRLENNAFIIKELQDQKYALDQSAIVAATDHRGIITYVNDNFCRISGYSRTELLGQTHRIINSGYHDRNFFRHMWKEISLGNVWRGEIKNRAKNGSEYWMITTIVPFKDLNGNIYQYLSIRQDITELKKAQEKILQQQAQLAASSKLSALGELSAALTHEINNPLGVILGRVEMLLEALNQQQNINPQFIKSGLESIQITAQRIEKIMSTIRSLAHKEGGEKLEAVTIQSILDSVFDILGSRFKRHQINYYVNVENPQNVIVCRPTEIFQILLNLLSNAIDATKEHSKGEPWVQVNIQKKNSGYEFCVIDSGDGVPDHVISKLFTPFFTTKAIGVGTGLGLTISQSLAHKNKGYLKFLNNHPTTFCFWIPEKLNAEN